MAKAWVIPVSEELNKEAFEEAHKLKISKSEFVRQAVKEKINVVKKTLLHKTKTIEKDIISPTIDTEDKETNFYSNFNPVPKPNEKQKKGISHRNP